MRYVPAPGRENSPSRLGRSPGLVNESTLSIAGDIDRQVVAVSPLLPRPGVVANAGEPEKAESEVRVRRPVTSLAVRHDFLVWHHADRGVHPAQIVRRFVGPFTREVLRPLEMDGAGNRTRSLRAHEPAAILVFAARVHDRHAGLPEPRPHVLPCRQTFWHGLA